MLDKGLQRNQENLVLEKKSQFPVQMTQNRDLRFEENRILQETQHTVQSNMMNSRPQGLSQEYSSSSGVPGQHEKRPNDFKPILREVTSPTVSAGANDISYRIVNEILNAESDKRSQMKLKVPTRVVERKKSPMVGHPGIENASETQQVNISKESKPVFEENTELRHLQEKIAEVNKQLEERKEMLENYKSSLRNESIDLEQVEEKLKTEQLKLKEKFHVINSGKEYTKDKQRFHQSKDRLKHLKAELHQTESEIHKLREAIEKQERDRLDIKQRISSGFDQQIQDFEEAIMSIEEQKLGIYNKLNEAVAIQNQNLEQKAMMKEDLSGRLLQRADLVAQREDLEQLIEAVKSNNKTAMEFYKMERLLDQQLSSVLVEMQELEREAQVIQSKIEEDNGDHDIESLIAEWAEMCEIEGIFNEYLGQLELPTLEMFYQEVLENYGKSFRSGDEIVDYLRNISEEEGESIREQIEFKRKIREEILNMWRDQVFQQIEKVEMDAEAGELDNDAVFLESLKLFLGDENEQDFMTLFQTYLEKVRELGNEKASQNEPEEEKEKLKEIMSLIKENEAIKADLESELDEKKKALEEIFKKEASEAFESYLQQQTDNFEKIREQYGEEALEDMKEENFNEFLEITKANFKDSIERFRSLQAELKYFEQTIQNNTSSVDEKILPILQGLLPSIEEGSVLVTALKKQQMLLLETEDEVTGQLDYILEHRDNKIVRSQEKYNESIVYPTETLREARKQLESKAEALFEEISQLENEIIENDKLSSGQVFEERKMQNELKQLDHELYELYHKRRPHLGEMENSIETIGQQIRDMGKYLEQLEMQKLTLEQQHIEQNYLYDEVSYQSSAPVSALLNEKSMAKTLNLDLKEIKESLKSAKNEQIKKRVKNYSDQNLDLSPIDRSSPSSDGQEDENPKKDFVSEFNDFPPVQEGEWNCTSPSGGKVLTESLQRLAGKNQEEIPRNESSYFKNYQKKLVQKHHEKPEGESLSQQTSPKGNFNKPPQPQNYHNLPRSQGLQGSQNSRMDENLNIFSPKTLSLNINSLKPPGSTKAVPRQQPSEMIYQNMAITHQDRPSQNEREDANEKNAHNRQKKSLSVETSLHLDDNDNIIVVPRRIETSTGTKYIGDNFSFSRTNITIEGNEPLSQKVHHNMNNPKGIPRRDDHERHQGEEEFTRSKSSGVRTQQGGRLNMNLEESVGRGYLNIEDLEIRNTNMAIGSSLRSPNYGARFQAGRDILMDIKSRISGGNPDAGYNEALFFETIEPLVRGSFIYKKFTNYQSLKRTAFDPLLGDVNPPEACGYGVRSMRLHPNLDRIEVRLTSKPGIELSISVDQILRPIVPQITMDILRVQRKIIESHHTSGNPEDKFQMAEIFGDLSTKALLAQRGVNNLNNGLERYLTCSYYSFSILLEKSGKIEFVASSYNVFKEWIHGINMLLRYKKHIPKLRQKIKNYKM